MEDLLRSNSSMADFESVEDLKLNEIIGTENPAFSSDRNSRIIHK